MSIRRMIVPAAAMLALLAARSRAEDRLADGMAKLVAPRLADGEMVGMVVGVVRGERSEVFGFGRADAAVDRAPDGKTIFEIGSITKVFTSLALADMAREGLVRIDDPVAAYLPAGVRLPDRDGRAITLRTLANHTSGLPRVMPKVIAGALATGDPYARVGPDDVYHFLGAIALSSPPGESFAYSNVGAGLLGLALARRAGTSYQELVVARICRPLGMSDTVVAPDAGRRPREARPYERAGEPAPSWHFDALAGAGALRSTADDLIAFARANLGLAPAPTRLRQAMLDMRATTADAGRGGRKVGLAWIIAPGGDRPASFFHNGGTGGFRSYLAIAPAAKAAVVVLSNTTAEVDSIGDAILGLAADPVARAARPESRHDP